MNKHLHLLQHFMHGIVELTVEWGGETIKKMRNIKLYANKNQQPVTWRETQSSCSKNMSSAVHVGDVTMSFDKPL